MQFAFTEEQDQLRSFVRQFLEEKSDEATVRALMETEAGYDEAVWSQMAEQLGLQSLVIPEEFGGQGFGWVELIIVLEEMGRSLLCAPFFSTAVLATSTLLLSNDEAAQSEYLPKIASGELTATLALTEENGRWDETGVTAEATADGEGWVINGAKHYVLDGHTAGLLLVAARTAAGVSVFAVDGDAAGVERTPPVSYTHLTLPTTPYV